MEVRDFIFSFTLKTPIVINLKASVALLAILWPALIFSQTQWDVTSSRVEFFINNAGIEVDGTIEGFFATILFSPEALSSSNITASLKTSTINSGIDVRDNSLRGEDYFEVTTHPTIAMTSSSFRQSRGNYIGTFNLTVKGVTRQIDMPFTVEEANGLATFTGSFTIDRLDFGVGESSWVLSDDVKIEIMVKAKKR